MKNLHRTRLNIFGSTDDSDKDFKQLYESVARYPVCTAVERLNGTWSSDVNRAKSLENYFFLTHSGTVLKDIRENALRARKTRPAYYVVPSLYDEEREMSYDNCFFNLFALCAVLFVFHWFSKFFRFDWHTWHPTRTFPMIIGVGNPRDPVYNSEKLSHS